MIPKISSTNEQVAWQRQLLIVQLHLKEELVPQFVISLSNIALLLQLFSAGSILLPYGTYENVYFGKDFARMTKGCVLCSTKIQKQCTDQNLGVCAGLFCSTLPQA